MLIQATITADNMMTVIATESHSAGTDTVRVKLNRDRVKL